MATLFNGGGLLLVVLLLALALVHVLGRRPACTSCLRTVEQHPHYWLVDVTTGAREPLCRSCFALSMKYGKYRDEPDQ